MSSKREVLSRDLSLKDLSLKDLPLTTSEKKLQKNELLANVIFVFHCVIILFVLFAPFTYNPALLILHITFCISLLIHWVNNSNACSLTLIESQLRGLDHTDTFSHKFISPIYDISATNWNTICYIITIFVLLLSIYFLIKSDKFKQAYNCYCELKFDKGTTLYTKFTAYLNCVRPLFEL